MLVPSIVALIVMPLVLWFICPPEIKDTHNAKKLAKMGTMSTQEKIILSIFAIILVLWAGVLEIIGIKGGPYSGYVLWIVH